MLTSHPGDVQHSKWFQFLRLQYKSQANNGNGRNLPENRTKQQGTLVFSSASSVNATISANMSEREREEAGVEWLLQKY